MIILSRSAAVKAAADWRYGWASPTIRHTLAALRGCRAKWVAIATGPTCPDDSAGPNHRSGTTSSGSFHEYDATGFVVAWARRPATARKRLRALLEQQPPAEPLEVRRFRVRSLVREGD